MRETSHEGASEKFTKPGGATHTRSTASSGVDALHDLAGDGAIGLIRMGLASRRGRAQAKSPCSGFWGRSTTGSGASTNGRTSSLWALRRASARSRDIRCWMDM